VSEFVILLVRVDGVSLPVICFICVMGMHFGVFKKGIKYEWIWGSIELNRLCCVNISWWLSYCSFQAL